MNWYFAALSGTSDQDTSRCVVLDWSSAHSNSHKYIYVSEVKYLIKWHNNKTVFTFVESQ